MPREVVRPQVVRPILTPSETASLLIRRGYHPIPIVYKNKAPASRDWLETRLRPDELDDVFAEPSNIGLLLGTEIAPRCFLTAIDIDVDDPLLIERIRLALGDDAPAKKGSKGCTFFAIAEEPLRSRRIMRKDPTLNTNRPAVEILAKGCQTVIPPSVHPKGMDFEWIGVPLFNADPAELPRFDRWVMDEIETAVKKPDSNIFGLNDMVPSDGGQPGTVHNAVLAAVASFVGLGWDNETIWRRVSRASRRADERAGKEHDRPGWYEAVCKMADDARTKGFGTKTKKTKIHMVAARWFIDVWRGKDAVYQKDGMIFAYKDGYYERFTKQEMRGVIAREFPEPNEVSLIHDDWERIAKTVLDLAPPFPEPEEGQRKVCLLNGTVNMNTGELEDWSKDDNLIAKLKFAYDPEAECPEYERFVYEVFQQDDPDDTLKCVNCFEEFIAHTLFRCLEYQKFLVIRGEPGSGKSTLIHIARMLHSPHAISAVAVSEFGNERYRTAMVGKLANLVTEVAATSHASDDFLKAVTSGDLVQVRFLYGEPLVVRLDVRLVITCNALFRIRDASGAVERRMLLLDQGQFQIPKEKQDKGLLRKLKHEMPGIFNRMVRAWIRLQERGYFDTPSNMTEHLQKFTEENNHVIEWYKARTHQGIKAENPEYELPKQLDDTPVVDLYSDFAEWSKTNGFKQLSSISFGMRLSAIPGIGKPRLVWFNKRPVKARPITLLNTVPTNF